MVRRKRETPTKLFTELELLLMQALWRRGSATVADVKRELASERTLAHTTVATMLKVLEGKGAAAATKEGRGLVYRPIVDKAKYEARALDHVVENVFDDSPLALVRRLLGDGKLGPKEIDELRRLLDDGEKK